jgi:hypothetical protein
VKYTQAITIMGLHPIEKEHLGFMAKSVLSVDMMSL